MGVTDTPQSHPPTQPKCQVPSRLFLKVLNECPVLRDANARILAFLSEFNFVDGAAIFVLAGDICDLRAWSSGLNCLLHLLWQSAKLGARCAGGGEQTLLRARRANHVGTHKFPIRGDDYLRTLVALTKLNLVHIHSIVRFFG